MSPINISSRIDTKLYGKEIMEAMRTATRSGMKAIAEKICPRAKENLKKNNSVVTGVLSENIKPRTRKTAKPNEFMAQVSTVTKGKMRPLTNRMRNPSKDAIADLRARGYEVVRANSGWTLIDRRIQRVEKFGYGAAIEVGNSSQNARPYIRPALIETIPEIPDILQAQTAKEAAKQRRRKRVTK